MQQRLAWQIEPAEAGVLVDVAQDVGELERAAEMARVLNRRGVLTRLRWSAGQAIDGGCGQLRARDAAPRAAQRRIPIAAA